MENLHPTQMGILNRLLFGQELRYTDLKIDPDIENNTFQFHLNKVIDLGYVEKTQDGYMLTEKGKVVANYIDIPKNEFSLNRKSSVRLYILRDTDLGREVLIKRRFKHPFYGQQGFPTGKILKGELFADAALRVAHNELNLEGNPKLIRVVHYLVKVKNSLELLDDKLFFDFYINNPSGELKFSPASFFEWILLKDFDKHMTQPMNKIEEYKSAFELIDKDDASIAFLEGDQVTEHL